MKALVTGGGGFLGSTIVQQLLKRGDTVRSFSRKEYPGLTKLGVEHIQGDLSDEDAVSNAVAGCDVVFHVAALPGIWGPYEDYYRANVTGTENILAACKKHGIPRLVYTSSPSVVFHIGNQEGVDESTPYPESYLTAYPETKAIAERKVIAANSKTLSTTSLRPHLIWGPGDNQLMPNLADRARSGRLKFIGDGNNIIDSVYVENAAKAHILAAEKLKPGSPVAGKVYFITNGEPKPISEIMPLILSAYDVTLKKKTVPFALALFAGWLMEMAYRLFRIKGEPLVTRFVAHELSSSHWYDISAARNDFGYKPEEIPIEKGVKLLHEYNKKHGIC